MMGFDLDDEDEPELTAVKDGQHSSIDAVYEEADDELPSRLEAADDFVALCTKLRELGCTKVEAGDYKAEFATPQRVVMVEPAKKEHPLALSPPPIEDVPVTPVEQRRRERAQIMERIGG